MTEKRNAPRLKHRANVRLIHRGRESIVQTRDLSNTGLFLLYQSPQMPEIGELLQVQSIDIDDALLQTVRVVRIEPGRGIGVMFVNDNAAAS